ncbi:MAG: hypothetical protein LBT20_02900 [Clostridiales bacterium]|jgi:hypothetical protein|nr:hypothetical protein [Clostridiales bacterium]
MSVAYFIASDKPFSKNVYEYKYILDGLKADDMWYDSKISFDETLWESEDKAIGPLFKGLYRYSIRSAAPFGFEKNLIRADIQYYDYAKKQIVWLKSFLKKHLKKAKTIFIVKLVLGHENDYARLRIRKIDINDFNVEDREEFLFDGNFIYQFVDNGVSV